MKMIGIIFIALGVADFLQYDLWLDVFHIELPDIVWRHSACVEILAGYFLIKSASNKERTDVIR